jgi:hypothetical protein
MVQKEFLPKALPFAGTIVFVTISSETIVR